MYIHGDFINERGQRVRVEILTKGETAPYWSRTPEKVIGENGLYFPDSEAVTLEWEVNDLFDHILIQSASIKLQTRSYMPELFAADCLDVVVNVRRQTAPGASWELLFAGYVLPLAYSQPFNSVEDDLELSCVDALGALQYRKYGGIGQSGVDYAAKKAAAKVKPLLSIVRESIAAVTGKLLINPVAADGAGYTDGSVNVSSCVTHDLSVKIAENSTSASAGVGVSEALFYEDDEEDVWTLEDVVAECVRFCNLHIRQEGARFKLFNWTTAAESGTAPVVTASISRGDTEGTAYGADTKIEIGEIYNKFELTDEVTKVDTLIKDPLDKETLGSDYAGRQLYCRTFSGTYSNKTLWRRLYGSANAMMCAMKGLTPPYKDAKWKRKDWYVRLRTADRWNFSCYGDDQTAGKYQDLLLSKSRDRISAFLVSLHSDEYEYTQDDTSGQFTGKGEDADYLCISTGAWMIPYKINGGVKAYAVQAESLTATGNYFYTAGGLLTYLKGEALANGLDNHPLATYTGDDVQLSPITSDVTRYLVFSGSFLLNPDLHGPQCKNAVEFINGVKAGAVEHYGMQPPEPYDPFGYLSLDYPLTEDPDCSIHQDGEERTHFMSVYYKALMPGVTPEPDTYPAGDAAGSRLWWGLPMPDTDVTRSGGKNPVKYVDETADFDRVNYVPLVACRLRVGDKVLVETSWGKYEWRTYKERSQCTSVEEFLSQIFSIGINPKQNETMLGAFIEVADTCDSALGIEGHGLAIPIKQSDNLHGRLIFDIMGIYNLRTTFNANPKPGVWWKYSDANPVPDLPAAEMLLNYVSAIWIKDFEVKVVSDNGGIDTEEDKDIIYTSDTAENFINKKDDLSFRICSALSKEKRKELGVDDSLTLSVAVDMRGAHAGEGVQNLYSVGQDATAPAEQLYVDYYYNLLSRPRLTLEQGFKEELAGWNKVYRHPALGTDYTFFPIGIKRDLSEGSATVKGFEL